MANNLGIDFSPLQQLGDRNKQLELAWAKNKLAEDENARAAELQPFKVSQARQQVDTGELDLEGARVKRFGGLAQSMLNEADPAKRQQNLAALAADPGMKRMYDKYLPPGWENNHDLVAHWTNQVAQGWKDPGKQALEAAQTKELTAKANEAGVKVVPAGSQAININPSTVGGKGYGDVIAGTAQKPPPGYEIDPARPGEYRPMIGGPADIKFTEAKNKALTGVESASARLDDLVDNIKTVLNHPGLPGNFGLTGVLPNIPGGASADALARLEQLKSQGSLASLQALRATGATLGAVSDSEGARLEQAFGALQRAQSITQVKQELEKIIRVTQENKARLNNAYQRQYGTATPAQTPTHNAPRGGIPEGSPGSRTSPAYAATPEAARGLPPGVWFTNPKGELLQVP